MKLSVSYSQALSKALLQGSLQVDAIEMDPTLSFQEIAVARSNLPLMPFHFHQGRMRFNKAGYASARKYLGLCEQSPWLSIHLAPLPAMVTFPALRWGLFLPSSSPSKSIRRFIQQVKKLQLHSKRPVILENMPTLHPSKYRFESQPETIWQILQDTGCKMLLDLAHARIAAESHNLKVKDYLKALPLDAVIQIHLAGVRRNARNGRLYDAHEALSSLDYELLGWTLEQCRPQWLTLEFFRENPDQLFEQVQQLRKRCPLTK
jgi:uncharacterized protein (UPF0276 family)